MNALTVEGLTKTYPSFTLDHVSFSLKQGRIMGLIGKNGAGKSTTLKSILNLVSPDGGRTELLGMPFPNAGMYDENWTPVDVGDSVYQLWIEPLDSGVDGLGKAKISVTKYGLNVIFEIEAAWQEEVGFHG